jgi:hypothetical protein
MGVRSNGCRTLPGSEARFLAEKRMAKVKVGELFFIDSAFLINVH